MDNKQNQTKQIRYLNRDFDSLLKRMIDYTKYYYPESFNDFSPASPAMIFLQMIAYVGDVLNFYIDKQTKQSILLTATQKESIYNIAQSFGYQIKTATPSSIELTLEVVVPTVDATQAPDWKYAPIINPGMQVTASDYVNSLFTVLQPINFKDIATTTVLPTQKNEKSQFVILRKKVYAYSLMQKEFSYNCGQQVQSNLKIYLPQKNIVKITKVIDGFNKQWYQVLNLSDDQVVSQDIKYNNGIKEFKRIKTTKRFKKYIDQNNDTYLYFGSKQPSNQGSSDRYKEFYSYVQNGNPTPTKLLVNNAYGEVPTNTTLKITYLISSESQVPSGSIDKIVRMQLYDDNIFTSEQLQTFEEVVQNISVQNLQPSIGGSGVQSLDSIKTNTIATIGTQNRLVTFQDYKEAIKVMPSQYGSVARSYIQKNPITNKIELWVNSYDYTRRFAKTPNQIKVNLGQFLQKFRLLGQYFTIKDIHTINLGCNFNIVVDQGFFKREVLVNVINVVKDYMNTDNFQVGTPIDRNILRNKMLAVRGVVNVFDLNFYNIIDQDYSNVSYNMQAALINQKYFPSSTPSIFQIKNPDKDIVGSVIN